MLADKRTKEGLPYMTSTQKGGGAKMHNFCEQSVPISRKKREGDDQKNPKILLTSYIWMPP